jgi:hypothetical protein
VTRLFIQAACKKSVDKQVGFCEVVFKCMCVYLCLCSCVSVSVFAREGGGGRAWRSCLYWSHSLVT